MSSFRLKFETVECMSHLGDYAFVPSGECEFSKMRAKVYYLNAKLRSRGKSHRLDTVRGTRGTFVVLVEAQGQRLEGDLTLGQARFTGRKVRRA